MTTNASTMVADGSPLRCFYREDHWLEFLEQIKELPDSDGMAVSPDLPLLLFHGAAITNYPIRSLFLRRILTQKTPLLPKFASDNSYRIATINARALRWIASSRPT